MSHAEPTTTLAIKPCSDCGAGLTGESKFCRWCGARQPVEPGPTDRLSIDSIATTGCYNTTPLATPNRYHPVSGPLVRAVAAGVPKRTSLSTTGGLTKRMLLALMAIPIWVMIILLSPIDAYASAKIIGQRV